MMAAMAQSKKTTRPGSTADLEYQWDFSKVYSTTVFDEEGRLQKARKTVAVLLDAASESGMEASAARVLDIGCSTGILTRYYSDFFARVVGIDIDDGAIDWARRNRSAENIKYRSGDSMDLPFDDCSFEVVTCTHIYEHVPDAGVMIGEIHRVMRPGGLCFFAAENKVRLWDGHSNLPLVTMMPRAAADLFLRVAGRGRRRYETHLTLRGLRQLVAEFDIIDYTAAVVADPEGFEATDMVEPGSIKQKLALSVLNWTYWAFPTYLWVLKKPVKSRE
jgi:2-polyprenyl-3-methyl-5-hydroxy-6-metoxy-1,4-benzoquinol methylase